MELTGEILGGVAGSIMVAEAVPPSLGTSPLLAPPVIVGTSATGGYALERGAK